MNGWSGRARKSSFGRPADLPIDGENWRQALSSRRTIIVLVAAALATVAALATFSWLRGVEARAYEGAELVRASEMMCGIVRRGPDDARRRQSGGSLPAALYFL